MIRRQVAVLIALATAPGARAALPAEKGTDRTRPAISLTLIPPSPVTDRIILDVRGAVWNHGQRAKKVDVTFYLDEEKPKAVLHRGTPAIAPKSAQGVYYRWPTVGRVGKHRILMVARCGTQVRRAQRPIEVLASKARSTQRIGGAWVDIYHHSEGEGRYFNAELAKMTAPQWRELVRAMHAIQMDVIVNTMLFQNYTHYGRHTIERDGYRGRAYYPSRLFRARMPIACEDPMEAILSEADKLGMHVFPGIGTYAFFDYTPGSLAWHKKVAHEVWQRYGHHPSFYGWYVSAEIAGDLGGSRVRWDQIVEFFRQFRAHCRRMAPDKPVMLATNSHRVPKAVDAYRRLLGHLDILCPFGFHRMPAGDLTGEKAAKLLQALCDRAGAHLWMDLETFVFHKGGALYPRPVTALASDIRRFPNFEKILCYQFPGLLSAPGMSRRPGGPPSVKLYRDYKRFLAEGFGAMEVKHAALKRPVALAARYDPRYRGGGDGALTDGLLAGSDYRDPAWQGYWQVNLEATIDLGRPVALRTIGAGFLQQTRGGIFLPEKVEVAVSTDGKEYRTAATVGHKVPQRREGPLIHRFVAELAGSEARYLRVRARNLGAIPDWHPARGQKAWLFVDEIVAKPREKRE